MSERSYKVLFLCTGNSARSILAEAILGRLAAGRFKAFSAGSFPKGAVHPGALRLLDQLDYDTGAFRSKSWDEFAAADAPKFDFIITVCDSAAGESCPVWPGKPIAAHWGIEDPAAVEGDGQREAFETAMRYLKNRISLLLALRPEALEELELKSKLSGIGRTEGATPSSLLT